MQKELAKKSRACWKGYTKVGTKTKNGREVPNCVPNKKGRIREESALHTMLVLETAASEWFSKMSPEEQKAYKDKHPRSKMGADGVPEFKHAKTGSLQKGDVVHIDSPRIGHVGGIVVRPAVDKNAMHVVRTPDGKEHQVHPKGVMLNKNRISMEQLRPAESMPPQKTIVDRPLGGSGMPRSKSTPPRTVPAALPLVHASTKNAPNAVHNVLRDHGMHFHKYDVDREYGGGTAHVTYKGKNSTVNFAPKNPGDDGRAVHYGLRPEGGMNTAHWPESLHESMYQHMKNSRDN